MKIKEILEITVQDLEKMMTEAEYDRMQKLNLETWQLLNLLCDSARESGQDNEQTLIIVGTFK